MPREQYQANWKDYYEILQLHPKAEPEIVAAAYRRMALMYHADVTGEGSDESFRMVDINEANEVLPDPARRAKYDQVYWARQSTTDASPGPWAPAPGDSEDADNQDWDAQSESAQDEGSGSGTWTADAEDEDIEDTRLC